MQTRTITVDYARPRGYDVGYRAENNFTLLALPIPAELESADSYRVYFESTVGEYLQTEPLTPADGYVTVKITSDVVPEPGNMAAQLVAFADGEIVGYAPMITGSAKVSIPDGTERLSHSLAAEIALNTAARHTHENKAVLDKFAESKDGKPTYDGEALGGGSGGVSTAEDVSYINTQLPNVANVKTALDELVSKSHSHANKDILDKLSVSDGKLQYNGSDVGLKGDKGADGANGKDGANGITPTIGTNGNWYLGTTDTGKPSQGDKGDKGDTGAQGEPGKDGADGAPGADGTSATHSWNGTVLTITSASGTSSADLKGEKGDQGEKGDKGDTGAAFTYSDFTAEQLAALKGAKGDKGDKGEAGSDATVTAANIKNALGYTPADQKQLDDLIASGGFSVPIVDSVDEMVDTSKQYILKSTGTIWEWKETTTEKEVTVRNDITSGYERGRLSSGGANSGDVQTHTLTPLIDITKAEYQGKTIQIHLEGNRYFSETAETYIMTALFDPNKNTIIGRAYSTLDRNAGLLGALDNAGATAEIHSTNSATLTIPVPLTEDTGKSVGYLRFCGLGTVDGTVHITYTETQTVTEEAWTDTGVAFGGGGSIDTETLAKIAELNNEGTDPTTIKLLAKPVLDFYNASAYSDNDYTYSHLSKVTYPCRADIPTPFTVKWNHNEDAMRTTVAVDTKAIGTVNAYTMRTYDATGLDNFPIYNLLPNKTYYYKVTHVMSDGSLVEAKSGNFTTSSEPWRLLYIDGTQNVRDLGGWTGLNGKKVKYGKIIRGAALSDSSSNSLIVTGKGRLALGELKIQAELNLGAIDNATSIAANCAYKKIGYTNYATAITGEAYRAQFKEVLEWIVSCLNGTLNVSGLYQVQRNIYMHCQGGCDRTGTLSFQLLGLLGVSESDLAKEYELSSFSDVGFGRLRTTTKLVDTYDYVGMVEALKTYSGDTITDKFVSFATTGCGISIDTITSFRNLMLE